MSELLSAIKVVAPGRLHLGFLDLNGALGRRYGSLGLAIDRPLTEVVVSRAKSNTATGLEAGRALAALNRFSSAFAPDEAFTVDVRHAIPAHAGLGSGTQLALAIGRAVLELIGARRRANELGEMVERGARSAIGITAFEEGGFIVDGGRPTGGTHAPPLTVRQTFPDEWRVILVLDPSETGVHGEKEAKAFAALPEFPDRLAGHLCRLMLMRLLPGLVERDIAAFGSAVSEIQAIVGEHFAAAQGGTPWSSPAVGRIVGRLGAQGAHGLGQSSWGPTGFAFAASEDAAQRLYSSLVEEAKAEGLSLLVVRGRNHGAQVGPV